MAKIMIVEDETLIRFALADALIDEGHVVVECGNVLEAVAALGRHGDIDAVVTDIDMPGSLDGLDLVRVVRSSRPLMPIWVTSGRNADLSEFGSSVVFAAKPYDMDALARRMNALSLRASEYRRAGPFRSRLASFG